jgi:hypothetical protein
MRGFKRTLSLSWKFMLTPPWKETDLPTKLYHWVDWVVGWVWSLAGMVGGAFLAPVLLLRFGLRDGPYQDALVIAVTAAGGFVVQLAGWLLLTVTTIAPTAWLSKRGAFKQPLTWLERPSWMVIPAGLVLLGIVLTIFTLPLAAVGYGLLRYLTTIG